MDTRMLNEVLMGRSLDALLCGNRDTKFVLRDQLRILEAMKERTGVIPEMKEEDLEVAGIFQMGPEGIPGVWDKRFKELFDHTAIRGLKDVVNVVGFHQCAFLNPQGEVDTYPVKNMLSFDDMFTTRDALAEYLLEHGLEAGLVCVITEYVRKGRFAVLAREARVDSENTAVELYWNYEAVLREAGITDKQRRYLEKVAYLPQGIDVKLIALGAWKCAWYKAYYPEEFGMCLESISS